MVPAYICQPEIPAFICSVCYRCWLCLYVRFHRHYRGIITVLSPCSFSLKRSVGAVMEELKPGAVAPSLFILLPPAEKSKANNSTTVVVPLLRRYVPTRYTGTISATGASPHTATTGCSRLLGPIISGAVAGNRHYPTGAVEGPLLYSSGASLVRQPRDC